MLYGHYYYMENRTDRSMGILNVNSPTPVDASWDL